MAMFGGLMQFLEVAPESKLPWMFVQCLWVLYENIIYVFLFIYRFGHTKWF